MKREFYNSYVERFGKEFADELNNKINSRFVKYLRVNTLKISANALISRLSKKGFSFEKQKELDYCFKILKEPFALSSTEEYLLGYFYLQDKASMISVNELMPKPDELILDACSAPGGKSTLLSQLMNNEGVIISVDVSAERLKAQAFNIQRLGCINIASFKMDALKIKKMGLIFDKILLDAPCSATGMMWKEKKRIKSVNKHEVKSHALLQKKMIKSCFDALKKGGLMVYSTCSIEAEENEENVEYAKALGLKALKEKYFFPHIDETVGFFYAVLKKS
ncbi:MAG: RsmB/NOP family class I SAM-dependent RNA methyltransferase [Candidatus Nanoarchaeia archaeon]|nr:RsmB/NOP family class I SAM-dependent RNA methyltransferase [Candidatus Nanoarchaeia archaeon]